MLPHGIQRFIEKPVRLTNLHAALETCLGTHLPQSRRSTPTKARSLLSHETQYGSATRHHVPASGRRASIAPSFEALEVS